MSNQDDWVVIARFGKPHGIKGFVTVHSFTEPQDNILRYADWHAFINQSWQPLKIKSVAVRNKFIIAQIEGYAERDAVAHLTHVEIAVQKNQLADLAPGEYYWHQLIGMKVVNAQGSLFGTVTDMMPTGSNDVLVVEGDKRHLIPYLPGQFVLNIDENLKCITVDWDVDF